MSSPQFESVATKVETTQVSGVTVLKPAGVVEGDFLVAMHGVRPEPIGGTVLTQPAGFTSKAEIATTDLKLELSEKIAGPSEPASYTFTTDNNQKQSGAILRFSGVDSAIVRLIESDSGIGSPSANFNTLNGPDNSLVLKQVYHSEQTPLVEVVSPPAGYTTRFNLSGSTGIGMAAATLRAFLAATTSTDGFIHDANGAGIKWITLLYIMVGFQSGAGGTMGEPLRERVTRGKVELPKGTRILNPFQNIQSDDPRER